jgi:hypothetical protein
MTMPKSAEWRIDPLCGKGCCLDIVFIGANNVAADSSTPMFR